MEESDETWIVIASDGNDQVFHCVCCGAMRIDFGNVRVQITLAELIRLAQLVGRMARDVTTGPPGREGEWARDIAISFGSQRFSLRLTVAELGRFRSLLAAAWRRMYLSGDAAWPEDLVN